MFAIFTVKTMLYTHIGIRNPVCLYAINIYAMLKHKVKIIIKFFIMIITCSRQHSTYVRNPFEHLFKENQFTNRTTFDQLPKRAQALYHVQSKCRNLRAFFRLTDFSSSLRPLHFLFQSPPRPPPLLGLAKRRPFRASFLQRLEAVR